MKRTTEARTFVNEEDTRNASLRRWNEYESAWSTLLKSDTELTFSSIPWPLLFPASSVADITVRNISNFLFDSLRSLPVDEKETRKDRIRASLLRWHPDKLQSVISRVREDDLEAVKTGINAVVTSLIRMQAAEKIPSANTTPRFANTNRRSETTSDSDDPLTSLSKAMRDLSSVLEKMTEGKGQSLDEWAERLRKMKEDMRKEDEEIKRETQGKDEEWGKSFEGRTADSDKWTNEFEEWKEKFERRDEDYEKTDKELGAKIAALNEQLRQLNAKGFDQTPQDRNQTHRKFDGTSEELY